MTRPIADYVDLSDPKNPVYTKREMTEQEYADLQAKWAAEAARVADITPTLEERLAALEAEVAAVKEGAK